MSADWAPALRRLAGRHPNISLYIFGSTLYSRGLPNDLDLLVVYSTEEDFNAFRTELDQLEFSPLVDLVAMTPNELRGSGFLLLSRAVPLVDIVNFRGGGP